MAKLSSVKGASSAMILSFMLVCAACSKKESAQSTLPVVNPDQALAELGFEGSGEGLISWGAKSGENGTYIFKNVSIDLDDQPEDLKIEMLTLTGATMTQDEAGAQQATFASLKAEGLSLATEDNTQLTIDNFLLSQPTPETAKGFATILSQTDIEDFAESAAYGFGRLELNNFNLSGTNDGQVINFAIDKIDIADADKDKIGQFSLSDMTMSLSDGGASDNDDQSVNISLGILDFGDMPISQFTRNDGSYASIARQLSAMNPYDNFTDDITIADLDFDVMGVTGGMKSMTRRADVKGDVIAVTQKIEDFVLTPGDQVGPMQMLSALGYEQFEINSEGVTFMDKGKDLITLGDNYLSLKDGFNLSLDAKLEGYGAAFKQYAQNVEGLEDLESDEPADPFAQMLAMEDFTEELINSLNIHEFGMTLDDQGLAERGLSFAAMMQGTEPERVKSQVSGMMLMYTMMLQDDAKSQMTRQLIEAATDFINEPGTLKLGIYPSAPISGATLRSVFTDGAANVSADDLGFVAEGG